MSKLLFASLRRLKKSILFYITTVLILGISLWFSAKGYLFMFGDYLPVESAVIIASALPAGFNTLFISFFLGREYSDKTIRNKLVVGHTRNEVYAASLITTSSVTVLWVVMWFIGGIIGAYLSGNDFSAKSLVINAFVVLLYNLSFSSALTAVSMAVHSRALAIVFHTQIPPYLITFVLISGMSLETASVLPPVVSELRRFAVNIIPMGQWLFIVIDDYNSILYSKPFLMLLSAAVITVFTAVGLKVFKEKELK